jgi:hypothetical protein
MNFVVTGARREHLAPTRRTWSRLEQEREFPPRRCIFSFPQNCAWDNLRTTTTVSTVNYRSQNADGCSRVYGSLLNGRSLLSFLRLLG